MNVWSRLALKFTSLHHREACSPRSAMRESASVSVVLPWPRLCWVALFLVALVGCSPTDEVEDAVRAVVVDEGEPVNERADEEDLAKVKVPASAPEPATAATLAEHSQLAATKDTGNKESVNHDSAQRLASHTQGQDILFDMPSVNMLEALAVRSSVEIAAGPLFQGKGQSTDDAVKSLEERGNMKTSKSVPKSSRQGAVRSTSAAPLSILPRNQLNQKKDPITFQMLNLQTSIVDESFTPNFKAVGRIQVVQESGETFGAQDVIHLWLSYELEVASVEMLHKGTLTLTLKVDENSGVPEGDFELRVPLPRHDLSAEQAALRFDVIGWQPLHRGTLKLQRPMRTPGLN